MYRRIAYIAILLTAGFVSTAGRDRTRAEIALERAAFDWDKGDYVAALRYGWQTRAPRGFEGLDDGSNPHSG